ncbi:MAG: DUF1801 domain-containing protein [Candidatus Dojkabacteria bacterium]
MNNSNKATTPDEYFEQIDEPRKSHMLKIRELIKSTLPDFEEHIRSGMVGYGTYHYKYASGREGDWFIIGLASNKSYISIYACVSRNGQYIAEKYKDQLPKANIGKSCIRFKTTDDVDLSVIQKILLDAKKPGDYAM